MKKKKSIWSGVSVLIAAVLAIVAFVRSDTQIWLLTAAFTIWAIWVTVAFVFPYIQEQETEKRRAARRAAYDAQRQSLRSLSMEEEDGFGPLLLRHVNHRISAYLKAVYRNAGPIPHRDGRRPFQRHLCWCSTSDPHVAAANAKGHAEGKSRQDPAGTGKGASNLCIVYLYGREDAVPNQDTSVPEGSVCPMLRVSASVLYGDTAARDAI